MKTMSNAGHRRTSVKSGLADWMHEVLKQADRAADGFQPDPVHDLRVAIRRCRSIAEGLRAIDPDPRWKKMRRSAKELFASLGRLRDAQVMMEWIARLAPSDDPTATTLLAYCQAQEQSFKQEAELMLDRFDRRQWQAWARTLPQRAARLQARSEPFLALALERWMEARRLHNRALRTGRQASLHRLRIGVKKFRYVVEHFLPQLHEQLCDGLKRIQDLLGEVQDLNVLWETATRIGVLNEPATRERWEKLALGERDARIQRYKNEATGENSVWQVWRAGLPRGLQAKAAALKKLQTWAAFLDPDVRYSRRVTRLALQIHQKLARMGLLGADARRSHELLVAASSVVGVGRSPQGKSRPKAGERLIQGAERPLSWKRQDLEAVAAIARFHRGAMPFRGHSSLRHFSQPVQRIIRLLAGILRLADALAEIQGASMSSVVVNKKLHSLEILAGGFEDYSSAGEKIAAARYLLELSLEMPILVKPKSRSKQLKNNRFYSINARAASSGSR